jgi:surfactin synthase thioesterase subunit
MTSKSLPTIIFVPGAWYHPGCYASTIKLLESLPKPYKCVPVAMPSVGCKQGSPSRESWQPDIDAVRNAIDAEAKNGKDVLLIVHSAGALPANESLKGVDARRVKQMIIAGFMVDSGNSVLSFVVGCNPPCRTLGNVPQSSK